MAPTPSTNTHSTDPHLQTQTAPTPIYKHTRHPLHLQTHTAPTPIYTCCSPETELPSEFSLRTQAKSLSSRGPSRESTTTLGESCSADCNGSPWTCPLLWFIAAENSKGLKTTLSFSCHGREQTHLLSSWSVRLVSAVASVCTQEDRQFRRHLVPDLLSANLGLPAQGSTAKEAVARLG